MSAKSNRYCNLNNLEFLFYLKAILSYSYMHLMHTMWMFFLIAIMIRKSLTINGTPIVPLAIKGFSSWCLSLVGSPFLRSMTVGGVTFPLEQQSKDPQSVVYTGMYDTEGVTHTKSGERQPVQVNIQVRIAFERLIDWLIMSYEV